MNRRLKPLENPGENPGVDSGVNPGEDPGTSAGPGAPEAGAGSDVVVGVDGSTASVRALRWAVEVAASRGWSVEVVTAWPHDAPVFLRDVPGHYSDARDRARSAQQRAVHEATAGHRGRVRLHTTLENARPDRILAERSHDSRLLVLGSTGSHDLVERCRELGTCPVAVVAAEAGEPEVLPPLLAPMRG